MLLPAAAAPAQWSQLSTQTPTLPFRPHNARGPLLAQKVSNSIFHGVIHSLKNAIWTTVSVQSPENVLLHHVPYLGDLFLHLFSQPGSETWLCGQQLTAEALKGMPGF